jgi:Bacterial lectin/Abnormal spindle-like microcephaly-assoc'd, ASPM-SPD-2-Hydin/Cep192 domain 4/PQQ-like domain
MYAPRHHRRRRVPGRWIPRRQVPRRWIPRRTWPAAAVAAALALTAVAGALPVTRGGVARADEVTASQNLLRDDWDSQEPGLAPGIVSGGTFGELFSTPVQGQVYAQPLVVGSTVIVATEADWVYGLDAATGQVKWSKQLGSPWPAASEGCTDLTPDLGITSTPLYDPGTGSVYVVAETVPPNGSVYHPVFQLVGLDAQTGSVTLTVPVTGSPVNDPSRPFDPFTQIQRASLLLMDGSVYVAFGSHCDFTPYAGYVAGVNLSTQAVTMWTDEAGVTDDMAGIWQGGGGLMSDGDGRIFLASGNGISPAPGKGSSPPPELAESVVRLGVQTDGTLAAQDFFSPGNAPALDAADEDLGSGGPAGLPVGTAADNDLLAQAGKDGRVFVLNRDSLGGRGQGPSGSDADLAQAGPFGGQWGHPAVFEASPTALPPNTSGPTDNNYVYYVGRNDSLRALRLGADATGAPTLTAVANSTATFGFSSGSPLVTSNGTDPSTAVVWVVSTSDYTGANGTLEAYSAVPQAGTLQQIWSAPIGTASKFSVPASDSGRVFVGTRDGHVLGFGSPYQTPVTGTSPLAFQAAVGAGDSQTATIQATADISVSQPAISSSASSSPYSMGQATLTPAGGSAQPASFPVTMHNGDTLSVPVTFAPTAPGGASGSLTVPTTSADASVTYPAVNISLSGEGTQEGLVAAPGSLSFGSVPVGTSVPLTVNISNDGTSAQTVASVATTGGAFTFQGLPSQGTSIGIGQSVPVTVTYAPSQTSGDSGSLTITGSNGSPATIALTGAGVTGQSQLSAAPAAVDFGSVPDGQQATQTIDITNNGNLPAVISTSSVPDAPFGTPAQVATGLPVNPGYDLQIPVTFTPSSAGQVSWTYQLGWTDAQGTHTLSVPVTGTGTAAATGTTAVPPPGGGWRLNGSATMSGSALSLTPLAKNQAGSAMYPVPVPSDGLSATFTVAIGGGTGADGMTLSLLDPASAAPGSLGGTGGLLGFGGLTGTAVTLDTFRNTGYPSANFVGIATGANNGNLVFAATNSKVPDLRSGTHTVSVSYTGGTLSVSVDAKRYLSTAVTLPPNVLLGFTGATGGQTDLHTVKSATITAGGVTLPPPGGGWSYNGSAHLKGSGTRLTPATPNRAATVIYPAAVKAGGLTVSFDAQLGGGTGGSGLTFALLNPSATTVTSVGSTGVGLGLAGLQAVALTLDTQPFGKYKLHNFVGVSARTDPTTHLLRLQATDRGIGPLRSGTHLITVRIATNTAGTDVLIASLDGEQVFQQAEPELNQWSTVRLAFTAGTSTLTDVQTVRTVAISAQN